MFRKLGFIILTLTIMIVSISDYAAAKNEPVCPDGVGPPALIGTLTMREDFANTINAEFEGSCPGDTCVFFPVTLGASTLAEITRDTLPGFAMQVPRSFVACCQGIDPRQSEICFAVQSIMSFEDTSDETGDEITAEVVILQQVEHGPS